MTDEAAGPLLEALPEAERFASWHLVRPGGRIASRGAAVAELLDALGHERLARRAARAEVLVERVYRGTADRRDRLGKLVPDGPAPRRFP